MKTFLQILFIYLLVAQICFAQWSSQSSGVTTNLYSSYFLDKNIGWASGANGVILKTTNGGVNWIKKSSGTTVSLGYILFFDMNVGIVLGNEGTVKKSTNGGDTCVFG